MPRKIADLDLTPEQNEIAEKNIRLLFKCVKSFAAHSTLPCDVEDLIGIAYPGYARAIKNYDPKKGALSTLVYKSVRFEILKYMKRQQDKKEPDTVSLDEPIAEDGSTLAELIPSPNLTDETALKNLSHEDILEYFSVLSEKERRVMTLTYLDHLLLKEIGDQTGTSRQRILQILKRASRKIRFAIENKEKIAVKRKP